MTMPPTVLQTYTLAPGYSLGSPSLEGATAKVADQPVAGDMFDIYAALVAGSGIFNVCDNAIKQACDASAILERIPYAPPLTNTIAFTDSSGHIWMIEPNGSGLTENPAPGNWGNIDIAPDGSFMLADQFVRGIRSLWKITPGGTPYMQLTNYASASVYPFRISPDGTKAAAGSFGPSIQIVNLDNSGYVGLELATAPAGETAVFWSPDGTKLGFSTNTVGGSSQAWTCNVDGSGLTRLYPSDSSNGYQIYGWFSDSTHLLVNRTRSTSPFPIQVLKTQGSIGTETVLYTDSTETYLGDLPELLSPDNTRVAFGSSGESAAGLDIFTISGATIANLASTGTLYNNQFFGWA